MTKLSSDFNSPGSVPYFMWDEPLSVDEIKERLSTASMAERLRLTAKIMREARDTDVWHFLGPSEAASRWDELAPKLGRRRAFWEYLISGWREDGLLDA